MQNKSTFQNFAPKANHSKIVGTLEHLAFYYYYYLLTIYINIYKSITYLSPNKLVTVFQCSTDPLFDPFLLELAGTRRSAFASSLV